MAADKPHKVHLPHEDRVDLTDFVNGVFQRREEIQGFMKTECHGRYSSRFNVRGGDLYAFENAADAILVKLRFS